MLGRRLTTLGGLVLAIGCEEPPPPWEASSAAPVDSGAWAALPTSSAEAPSLLPAPSAPLAARAPAPSAAPSGPVRVGGPWVRCYGDFRPGAGPEKDLTRLALMCGPQCGMRRLSKEVLKGRVSEGAPPITTTFRARRGGCYRVFAVGDDGIVDLDVVVKSSRDKVVAADHGEDRWPVVQPDRPFCALADDRMTIEVSARSGAGQFAAEVWELFDSDRSD